MLFHFRIRGLSGIIESVVPCSHGQTLNRTVVDLHRHQLRFFLAALEIKEKTSTIATSTRPNI